DGDHSLNVYISVRSDPANPATENGRTDLMEHAAISGSLDDNPIPAPSGALTLEQMVFTGKTNPGNLVAVREIHDPTGKAVGANSVPGSPPGTTTGTPDTATAGDCGSEHVAPISPVFADTLPPTSITSGVTGLNCDISFYEAPFAVVDAA